MMMSSVVVSMLLAPEEDAATSDLVARFPCCGGHIRVPVGGECLLSATICADEYFSLFFKDAVSWLN
jgi:hypothetical protein